MPHTKEAAIDDFTRARQRANLEEIVAALTGKSADLLSFEDVRKKVRGIRGNRRVLKDVPLDSIVGSVGRYEDFTRDFLPLRDSDKERWARVERLAKDDGLPPVDLFQIGDAYFVNDGNHRVSVARQSGHSHIEAYVTPVHTRVPLSPEVQPKDLILKAELAEFLDCTRLDSLRPGADMTVTSAGAYDDLCNHIEVHHYFMGLDEKREVPWEEAVTHWYDTVFSPVIEVIRKGDLLSEFPGRTHADLYLWILRHRAELEKELNWEIRTEAAAADLAASRSGAPDRVITRVGKKLLESIVPSALDAGPPVGEWRRKRLADREGGAMFIDLLVAVEEGANSGLHGLGLGLQIARVERAIVHGLHMVSSPEQIDAEGVSALRVAFNRTCHAAGVPGRLAVEVGSLAEAVCERAKWSDLVVLERSGDEGTLYDIMQHASRPVLLVPGPTGEIKSALLVYDGSPKGKEALYVATYLASRHKITLTVFATREGDQRAMRKTVTVAIRHLRKNGVEAAQFEASGPIAEAINESATESGSDLIIIGGYNQHPLFAPKTSLDQLMRISEHPLLICR